MARPIPSVPPVTSATLPCNLPMLLLDPLIGQCDWRPAIPSAFLVQATQARKQQMRRRDQNILARELGQQLIPRRCRRRRVRVEHRRDLGVLQLDALGMDGIAPKQDLLALGRKLIAGMSRCMTGQRDDLHAVHDRLGAAERVPLAGLDVRRSDGLGALEERLRLFRRLGSDFWRQPKVALSPRDVNLGIWEDTISIVSGEAADVIGVQVRDQDEVDLLRRIARAAEAGRQAPSLRSAGYT